MVAGRLKEERPTIRCAYTHPRQRNTEYSVITDSAEEELRKTLLAGGFRIKSLKLLSEAELKAEERKRRDWEGKLIRNAVRRALEAQAQAVRFALAGSERWVSIHHLVAGKWVSAARLATGGGRGVAIPDGWTGLTLWRGLRQRLAQMAAVQFDGGHRRQTGRIRLRLEGRAHDFQISFNRRSIRIDLDR